MSEEVVITQCSVVNSLLKSGKPWEFLNPEGEWMVPSKKAKLAEYAALYEIRAKRTPKKTPAPVATTAGWVLPAPPDGRTWRWAGSWKQADLPTGFRPLLNGEDQYDGDEEEFGYGGWRRTGAAPLDRDDAELNRVRTVRAIPVRVARVPQPTTYQRFVETWTATPRPVWTPIAVNANTIWPDEAAPLPPVYIPTPEATTAIADARVNELIAEFARRVAE